jgi:hypothetical protein
MDSASEHVMSVRPVLLNGADRILSTQHTILRAYAEPTGSGIHWVPGPLSRTILHRIQYDLSDHYQLHLE